jgi:hypothetical protein
MVLYITYIMTRSQRNQGAAVAAVASVGYLASQLALLSLGRAREFGADHWSCEATGDGDALASALLKVAYGIGQVDAERKDAAARLKAQGGRRSKAQRPSRVQAISAMGIFEPHQAEAVMVAFGSEADSQRALSALRWDVVNPWGRTLEKLSSHPLVARRILALADSGLPGAPRQIDVRAALAGVDPATATRLRSAWRRDLLVGWAPWVLLVAMAGFGALTGSTTTIGIGLLLAGIGLVRKQGLRYPNEHPPAQIADLLHRLDAGPVQAVGVELHGRFIGRGFPGYVLSPDLVLQDETGFVPVLYRQPIPLARFVFALSRARTAMGQDVVVKGWYRRTPGPVVELESFVTRSGESARAWMWAACMACSAGLAVAGLVVAAAGVFA